MTRNLQQLFLPAARLISILLLIALSLWLFLFHIADYNVYRVLDNSWLDLLFLLLILGLNFQLVKHGLSDWLSKYFQNPFHKMIFLLLICAGLNASLVFWMHEEANEGRHIEYARQLAERRDTVAENELTRIATIAQEQSNQSHTYDFWEKQWINNPYLASNYQLTIKKGIANPTNYRPILSFDETAAPIYQIYLSDSSAVSFKLKTDFRKSIYTENIPYKELENLRNYQFAVVKNSKIVLSNTRAFDQHLFGFKLPSVGQGTKIKLEGFDILAYRHSEDTFVLIGEPLSEVEVWISNFAFFFSLIIGIITFFEILRLVFLKEKIINYWQQLPIQHRIQIVLISLTCIMFLIIATTTFIFLQQNNLSISYERQQYISETLRDEIIEEQEQYDRKFRNWEVSALAQLADRKKCDIDFYSVTGELLVSSSGTAVNSPAPANFDPKIATDIRKNPVAVILVKQHTGEEELTYLRTYFGIFNNNELKGVASISSFESEIGTAPYIPIVMIKLLSVYVFLLLLTWGAGLMLINLLTRPLELIADRLSDFKLEKQNEKLKWLGNDAIGQLISQYNSMVDKVERTTKELINREREGAWQIMAQQIAHEINNKLTPLKLSTQFLSRMIGQLDPAEAASIQRVADGLIEKINGLSKVATQFKLFANLESPAIQPTELTSFLSDFYVEYTQKEDVDYHLEMNPANGIDPVVNIDTHHLTEILNNLITNAEQAIPENRTGKINLRLKMKTDHALIQIEDNGKGIPPEIIKNIFDPKFSVTSSQTGLGLPLCKKVVEFYGGKLSFNSVNGKGTCLMITFPLANGIATQNLAVIDEKITTNLPPQSVPSFH